MRSGDESTELGKKIVGFSMKRYSVAIVDTSRLFREGLAGILRDSCFDVMTAAADTHEALAGLGRSGEVTIDLLIYSLEPQSGIDLQIAAIRTIRLRDAALKIVLLMPSCTAEDLIAAVLCGVDGVILKDVSGEKLIAALDLVMHDQHVLPLGVALEVFTRLLPIVRVTDEPEPAHVPARDSALAAVTPTVGDVPRVQASRGIFSSVSGAAEATNGHSRTQASEIRNLALSNRETQILQCLVEGCANKLIARRLDIAEATVKVHIKSLLRKINVSNRTQAAIWAINQNGGARPPRGDDFAKAAAIAAKALADLDRDNAMLANEPLLSEMMVVFPHALGGTAQPTHN